MRSMSAMVAWVIVSLFAGGMCSALPSPGGDAGVSKCAGVQFFARPILPITTNFGEQIQRQNQVRLQLWVDETFSDNGVLRLGGRVVHCIGGCVVVESNPSTVQRLTELPGVKRWRVSHEIFPTMDSARSLSHVDEVQGTRPSNLPRAYTGKGVITGILDTEFDTRHPAFLDSAGNTRFLAIWDQEDTTGKFNRFNYGTIKNHQELLVDTAFGLGAENEFHGTHTASTMAGSDRTNDFYGVAPDAHIVAVKIANADFETADGLRWIAAMADSLNMPCVINMSLGKSWGPHDGTSEVDRVIDSISGAGRVVVGAVGNDGNRFSHVRFDLKKDSLMGTWLTPSADTTVQPPRVMSGGDFWGEPGKIFTVVLYLLDGRHAEYRTSIKTFATTTYRNNKVEIVAWPNPFTGEIDTVVLTSFVERANRANGKMHLFFYVSAHNPNLYLGVTVSSASSNGIVVHGWHGFRMRCESFGMAGFVVGDSLYTVNELGGTAKRNITVGGYVAKTDVLRWDNTVSQQGTCFGCPMPLSGLGPTVDGRAKPDVAAPGWLVVAAMSRKASRTYDELAIWLDTTRTTGRYGAYTGTSMAAPIVSGIVALMLEAKPTLTPEEVRAVLQATAIKDTFTGPLLSIDYKWGAGKVNALAALQFILGVSAVKPLTSSVVASRVAPEMMQYGNRIIGFSRPLAAEARMELINLQGRSVYALPVRTAVKYILPATIAPGVYSVHVHWGAPGRMLQGKIVVTH